MRRRLVPLAVALAAPWLAAGAATPPAAAAEALGCLITPSRTANVGSPSVGVLTQVKVERGDRVRKGQLLATLRSDVERAQVDLASSRAQAEADVEAARKALEFAQRKQERSADLHRENFISGQAVDQAVAEADVARARLRQAQEQLRNSGKELTVASAQLGLRSIRSPIDGIVTDRFLSEGERVEERPILRIATVDPLHVEVVLPAAQFGRVTPGLEVTVQPELAGLAPVAATVSVADALIDPASNSFRARLLLPNADGRVPAGLRCKVRFAGLAAPPAATAPAAPAPGGLVPALLRPGAGPALVPPPATPATSAAPPAVPLPAARGLRLSAEPEIAPPAAATTPATAPATAPATVPAPARR